MLLRYCLLPTLLTWLLACEGSTPPPPVVDAAITEAREDSLALDAALAGQRGISAAVTARVETEVAKAGVEADAADDPAIWLHPTDPAGSLVFGSNKTGGMAAYDLAGREVAYYPIGKINNIDIIDNVRLGDERITLLGCSNRTEQSVNLFRINPASGALTDVLEAPLFMDSSRIDDVYGFCFARAGERVFAVVNGKNGVLEQFELRSAGGYIVTDLTRDLVFPSQTEGMVADEEHGVLYVGEEAAGIHRIPIVPGEGELDGHPYTDLIADHVGVPAQIVADVEGLTLYDDGAGGGYLIASIQGNFSYALFERRGDNRYLGSFKITDGPVDGAEETDGIEVAATPLPGFPGGLLVVQDGFNTDGEVSKPQNFKYVDFGEVLAKMGLQRTK